MPRFERRGTRACTDKTKLQRRLPTRLFFDFDSPRATDEIPRIYEAVRFLLIVDCSLARNGENGTEFVPEACSTPRTAEDFPPNKADNVVSSERSRDERIVPTFASVLLLVVEITRTDVFFRESSTFVQPFLQNLFSRINVRSEYSRNSGREGRIERRTDERNYVWNLFANETKEIDFVSIVTLGRESERASRSYEMKKKKKKGRRDDRKIRFTAFSR